MQGASGECEEIAQLVLIQRHDQTRAVGQLELALDGVVTTLQARIARRAGTAYGLVFPSCIKNGMPDPPASLMSMIETLKHHFDQGMRALEA